MQDEEEELMHVKSAFAGQAGCQSSNRTLPITTYDPEAGVTAVNIGAPAMAFSPTEAPVYGGEVLEVNLGGEHDTGINEEDTEGAISGVNALDELFLVLEGRTQTHIVTMKHTHDLVWQAPIPGHDCAEVTYLSVIRRLAPQHFDCVAVGEFVYQYDSAFYLAQFLVDSVNDPGALDDMELIRSDNFDLANEILSTLDLRLSSAFKHAHFPHGWHLLGEDQYEDGEPECRETLLHLAGRLGLHGTALLLLTKAGSQEALRVINHEGQLPCAVAAHNGFHDIAEIFSGYNTDGMITQLDEQLDTDFGIIRSHGNAGTSLTIVSEAIQNRSVESCIEELREMEATMKRGRTPGLRRQYQTDWPSPPIESRRPHNAPQAFCDGQADPCAETQVEETMNRILQEQRSHSAQLGHLMQEYRPYHHQPLNQTHDNSNTEAGGQATATAGGADPYSDLHLSSEVMMEARRQYGILEGSLSSISGINDGLLRLRGANLLNRRQADAQNVRRLGLSRFSTSCPSLDAQNNLCPLSPIHEGDQHKSMLDLAQEVGPRSSLAGQPPSVTLDDGFLSTPSAQAESLDDSDSTVRICVNGVTVDSTEDFPRRGSVDGGVKLRSRSGRLSSPRDEDLRRRSWCPDSPSGVGTHVAGDGGDAVHSGGADSSSTLQARILAMNGKSLSLSRLDCEEGSDDDVAHQTPSPRCSPGEATSHHDSSLLDGGGETTLSGGSHSPEDDLSFSPVDSRGSSPIAKEGPDGHEVMRKLTAEMMMASPQAAHSMSDLSSTEIEKADKKMLSMANMHGVRSYEEERGRLGVPNSPITKSLSTPSIPVAQAAEERRLGPRDFRKENKQPSELLLQKLVEEYDPTFRRQDEIEEEEEDASPGERKEISGKDFLSEDDRSAGGDSDEKSKLANLRKEEKKRKPNVFTRFQNSYRTKKHKDKDNKVKSSHHFVAVSFSNATACNVCHKPMANKPALRCENCLINVHEHSCKDQVSNCDKHSNMKVLQREGSAPAAMIQDKTTASLQGSGLRPSHSFKLKERSTSAPVKSQNSMASSHRHSVPSTGKAISEGDETDGVGQDAGPSNITEGISGSLESLDAVSTFGAGFTAEAQVLEDEPDLMLHVEEEEAWNVTVDRKTLKKMNAKDIKRQDTIWELIQTEKQYVKRLKIMQKLFRDPLMNELGLTGDQINSLFPCLDDLFNIHASFLRALRALQTISADRSIDEVGPTLLKQFSEETATKMKSAYGVFCSKHTEAIQLYKEIAKTDRKFQNYCRKTSNLAICEKRELPDFILGVTVRLSKYPILIEAIFKGTKDKKDREQLSRALQCSKVVVHAVDAQVAAYENLMDVYRSFDSRTTVYKGEKFKRQDLIAKGRQLLYAGQVGWKNARNRVADTYTLVLTDILVFLQKNEQKYTFFLQDNKSCVVPLSKLLVREKRDERESHGIYVISHAVPEMYELVCRTVDERDRWMKILQEAIKNCPEEMTEVQQQQPQPENATDEERRKQEAKANKIKSIIFKLHEKDNVIKDLCEEKNQLMWELMEFSAMREEANSRPSSQQFDLNISCSSQEVQAAMQEASRLTTILQGSGTQLSRSVSSAGEHVSMSYVNMLMPKRAETFAGFDTSFEAPKSGALLKKRFTQQFGDEEGRCPSELSLHNTDTIPEDCVISTDSRFGSQSGLSPQSLPSSTSSLPPSSSPQAWDTSPGEGGEGGQSVVGLDTSDHGGSVGELSASSVSSLAQPVTQQTSAEPMMSVVQLVKHLHNLMNLTAKQTTTVECLRVELAEAKEEINKLSQDMHGQRRSAYRHNQLEELRNLQENISRERQEWEHEKEKEQEFIRQEKSKLDAQRKGLERQENELRSRKEDLRREKETLQRQIDMMREQGLLATSALADPHHLVHTIDLDITSSSTDPDTEPVQQPTPPGHRRSASADLNHQHLYSGEFTDGGEGRGMPRRPRHSVSSLHGHSTGVNKQNNKNIPVHLMSTRNEQRLGGGNVQQLPMKLSLTNTGSTKHQQQQQNQQQPHQRTSSMSALGARPGGVGAGPAPVTSLSPQQAQGMITRNQNSRSTPSNLALVMKLAETPGGKKKASSGGGNQPAPDSSAASSSSIARPQQQQQLSSDGSPDRVIYF